MDNHQNDAYVKRHDDDYVIHVYQEENERHQSLSFTIFDGAGLTKLASRDVELMEEETVPSKKRLQKSKCVMHVLLKQIQMLMNFDNHYIYIYILKYIIKEINLLFFKCVHMFHHKSKRKGRKGDSSSSSQACSASSTDLFAVMVLLNF
jgi:hypothetical protein